MISEQPEERTKETTHTEPDASDLRSELTSLLNKFSRENVSNTPDFILRNFIWDSLKAFERGVRERDEWYEISPEPGKD